MGVASRELKKIFGIGLHLSFIGINVKIRPTARQARPLNEELLQQCRCARAAKRGFRAISCVPNIGLFFFYRMPVLSRSASCWAAAAWRWPSPPTPASRVCPRPPPARWSTSKAGRNSSGSSRSTCRSRPKIGCRRQDSPTTLQLMSRYY